MRKIWLPAVPFLVLIAFGATASAQSSAPVASATGKVIGPESKPQAGIPIEVTGPEGKTTAFTDANGNWSLFNLAPGTYQVRPAVGSTTSQSPIEFTVTGKGVFGGLFGTTQSNTFRAEEMKLDKNWGTGP